VIALSVSASCPHSYESERIVQQALLCSVVLLITRRSFPGHKYNRILAYRSVVVGYRSPKDKLSS